MVGPKLQADLPSLILKRRMHKYVCTADIEKMFRQILIHPSDVDYQRIFWREHPQADLMAYRLLTVTYGTASAPFLANRVLKQLAPDEGKRFPLASPILEEDVYVDDFLFGAEDLILLKQMREQLTQLLMAGGFRPRKWASNDPRLLVGIPETDHGLATYRPLGESDCLKVLGVTWTPSSDSFKFLTQFEERDSFTKRSFLSIISRVFDPLGWASPVTISAKILMQLLWLSKLGWDEPLPNDILQRCLQYQTIKRTAGSQYPPLDGTKWRAS